MPRKVSKAVLKWIEENQGKYLCRCSCGKPIIVKVHHYSVGIPEYCHGHHRRGIRAANHKGGCIKNDRGNKYWVVWNPNYGKNGDTRKQVPIHRLIGEAAIGRRLTANEDVHHIDHNGLNNENSNLIIVGRKDHSELHRREEILKYKITAAQKAKQAEAFKCFIEGFANLVIMTPF